MAEGAEAGRARLISAHLPPSSALIGALVALLAAPAIARATDPPPASPPPPRVALRWTAPAGCPPGERVVAEVDRILAEGGARPPAPLDARATVTVDPDGGHRVRLEVGRADARELRAASCEDLAEATALILALTIDPTASPPTPRAAPPVPAPPPPSAPPPAPPAAPPPAIEPAPSRGAIVPRFHLLAFAQADVGSLPRASFAAGGAFAVSLGALRLELGVAGSPAKDAALAQRPTAGGAISLITGSAGACWDLLAPSAFEIAPCLAVEVGRLHASGYGVTSPGEGSALWSAARLGGRFAWAPVRPIALVLRLEAAIPFARPSFVLENLGAVFRSDPVAGRAALGVEARF